MLRAWRRVALSRRLTKCRADITSDVADADAAIYSVVGFLDDSQLEALTNAVEAGSSDGLVTECIMVGDTAPVRPHFICCRLWRMPFLQTSGELRCMPWCQTKTENGSSLENNPLSCCHPYHWSRQLIPDETALLFTESPPPPYVSPASSEKQLSECCPSDLSDDLMLSAIGNVCDGKNVAAWCHISYWEFRHRVGPQFAVVSSWTNVSQGLPLCDGLSLAALQKQPVSCDVPIFHCRKLSAVDKTAINRTRAKIGRGIVISRECAGSVWLYNCSEYPVFITSPTLFPTGHVSCPPPVQRLPAGHCLCAFDASLSVKLAVGELSCGHYSIQVSFAKGWGDEYSRQFISACPCWVEVHITHPHQSPAGIT